MNKIIKFQKGKIRIRICPGCGYLISQSQIEYAVFDYSCYGCRKHKLSEFKPIMADYKLTKK